MTKGEVNAGNFFVCKMLPNYMGASVFVPMAFAHSVAYFSYGAGVAEILEQTFVLRSH